MAIGYHRTGTPACQHRRPLLAVAMPMLPRVFGESLGWIIFWSAASLQLVAGAAVVWRRTGLPRATAASALAALASAIWRRRRELIRPPVEGREGGALAWRWPGRPGRPRRIRADDAF